MLVLGAVIHCTILTIIAVEYLILKNTVISTKPMSITNTMNRITHNCIIVTFSEQKPFLDPVQQPADTHNCTCRISISLYITDIPWY